MANKKFSKEMVNRFVQYLQEGNYISTCCKLCGIDNSTFYEWKAKAEVGDPEYVDFVEKIAQAEAEAEQVHVKNILDKGKEGVWQCDAWWLERKFPEKWGRRDRINVGANDDDKQIEISIKIKEPDNDQTDRMGAKSETSRLDNGQEPKTIN